MFESFRWTKISHGRNEITRRYEPIQIDLLAALSRRCSGAVFLDIGANIGAYAISLSDEKGICESHAFEALPMIATELRKNLELNDLSHYVTVHQLVLSESAGQADFVVRSDYAGDGGVLDTHQYTHLPFKRIEKLEKRRVDDVLDIRGREIIAKIDVEGHELSVLKGAQETLRHNSGFLQIEILQNGNLIETEEFLGSLGWRRLWRIGQDFYFSNREGFETDEKVLTLLEECIQQFIDRTRAGKDNPHRKSIFPGFTIEIRRTYVDHIKSILGRGPKNDDS